MSTLYSPRYYLSILVGFVFLALTACGSSGGGGGNDSIIEGTLRSAAQAKALAAGEEGIGGVNVSALGDHTATDNRGNFTIRADGASFPGGAVEFTFSGQGTDSSVVLDNVLGGPGVTGYVNFVKDGYGISGESTDADGNVLSASTSLNCSNEIRTFGGNGELWKPVAESTGTVVILMPAEYRHAAVEILNNQNKVVDEPLKRSCCDHNAGREHIFLRRSAGSLATAGLPLNIVFRFPGGRVECRMVPNPHQRYE